MAGPNMPMLARILKGTPTAASTSQIVQLMPKVSTMKQVIPTQLIVGVSSAGFSEVGEVISLSISFSFSSVLPSTFHEVNTRLPRHAIAPCETTYQTTSKNALSCCCQLY
jgi:hypothetical protein